MRRVWKMLLSLISTPSTARGVAALGGVVYTAQAYIVARTRASFLDEGLYTYKGLLFARGDYRPFQEFGPWTNHMPLSFLIHGYVQKWFGPGLPAARYFMIFLGLLTLLGLWVLVRRWSGAWWAAGAVWAMALNLAGVKVYTLALSQGLIAFMLVWSLALTVGVRRPRWQLMLGAALASLMILTRLNMAFVLPLLLGYIFWQHGWKSGLWAALTGILVLILGHALFWPGIMRLWASWVPFLGRFLPASIAPIEELARGEGVGDAFAETRTLSRVFLYFWLTFRLHFVTLVSACATWLLWPRRLRRMTARVRAAIFLSILLLVLLGAHMAVTFGKTYCVSCILLYVAFFDFIGLILLAISYRFLEKRPSATRRGIILAFVFVTLFGVGLSAYEDINSDFARWAIERIRDLWLWSALSYKTGWPPLMLLRRLVSFLGSVLAAALFALLLIATRWLFRGRRDWLSRLGTTALLLFLAVGMALSPTVLLGRGNDFFYCKGNDTFLQYRRAGNDLRSVIPPGSQVYWEGRLDAVFLYIPDVKIYPPQLNHIHSFRSGGDPETLLRIGRWNEEMARRWLAEADYILIQKEWMQDWENDFLESEGYVRILSTPKLEKCRWQTIIDVYQRPQP